MVKLDITIYDNQVNWSRRKQATGYTPFVPKIGEFVSVDGWELKVVRVSYYVYETANNDGGSVRIVAVENDRG